MLNAPKSSDERAADGSISGDDQTPGGDKTSGDIHHETRKAVQKDASAEFIQELAESGSASELGTVNAAADAVEGKEEKAIHPKRKTNNE